MKYILYIKDCLYCRTEVELARIKNNFKMVNNKPTDD